MSSQEFLAEQGYATLASIVNLIAQSQLVLGAQASLQGDSSIIGDAEVVSTGGPSAILSGESFFFADGHIIGPAVTASTSVTAEFQLYESVINQFQAITDSDSNFSATTEVK